MFPAERWVCHDWYKNDQKTGRHLSKIWRIIVRKWTCLSYKSITLKVNIWTCLSIYSPVWSCLSVSHPGSRWQRCGRSPKPAASEQPAVETLTPPERRWTPSSYTPPLSTGRKGGGLFPTNSQPGWWFCNSKNVKFVFKVALEERSWGHPLGTGTMLCTKSWWTWSVHSLAEQKIYSVFAFWQFWQL